MFINENLEPVKLSDVTLPSAAFFKLQPDDPPIFGLLGIYEGQKQVIPVEKHFEISQVDDDIFQQLQPHHLFPDIEFKFDTQTDSRDKKIGSLVRVDSKLQIIAKSRDLKGRLAGYKGPEPVEVTLKDDYGNLNGNTAYYPNWQIFCENGEKICEKIGDNVKINSLR